MSYFPKTAEEFLAGQILLIDKPLGWTSFDLVKKVRTLIRTKFSLKKIKVGHAGTLDPLATGLLIVCTGKFTKRISEIQEQAKVYTGEITLGGTTPSYDLETEIDNRYETSHITKKLIQNTALYFTGEIDQKPPIFSALKKEGERLYKKARRGENVVIKPRLVHVYSFKIIYFENPKIIFEIECGSGTYIRSIAHDLGRALNSGGYLNKLCRTKIGDYHLDSAFDIKTLNTA